LLGTKTTTQSLKKSPINTSANMLTLNKIHNQLKTSSKLYWFLREQYVIFFSRLYRINDKPKKSKKTRVLFYHINSLGHAGTEKFLQILAKYLDKTLYEVYYLYPDKLDEIKGYQDRYNYLAEDGVRLIPFDYTNTDSKPPHFIKGMNPDIKQTITGLGIDVLVTPGAGCADYPFSIIKNVPIILLNIFGQPNVQNNITHHICISKEVADKIVNIVPENKVKVFPVPSEGPTDSAEAKGVELRHKFNIPESDMVFGRIGRAENNIHDPIGIEAFKIALKTNPHIHYLIMSPAPVLVEQVEREKIPNVYFVSPSSNEEDIWAFHGAIDVLAHFRSDGESFGLNIAESMLSGNPIITHKSHIWNAHLEYLDDSFARIAERNDYQTYAKYMLEFADLKKNNLLNNLGIKAKAKAEQLFLIENNIRQFEEYIQKSKRD
jgi:glycosyltransferase involved in cell wall biosynthesis